MDNGTETCTFGGRILKIKNSVTEIKDTFYGLASSLDTAEERISELEDTTQETSKMEEQRERQIGRGKKYRHPRTV